MKEPCECQSIDDVRNAIDSIDKEVISLLGRRFCYVKEIIRFKEPTPESIVAQERFNDVIASRREMAKKEGLNPEIIGDIYTQLLKHFIEEELRLIQNK